MMGILEVLIKFCAGGVSVVVISWLAKSKNPTLAGLFVLFPVITLVSFMFMLTNTSTEALRRASLGSIYYIPSTIAFLVSFYFANEIIGGYWGLAIALGVWAIISFLLVVINLKFLHI